MDASLSQKHPIAIFSLQPAMEVILFLLVFLLLYFMVGKILKSPSGNKSRLRLPPGPNPLPIIGNVHQLLGSPFHHLLRDLAKKYGPLMHLKLGETTTIIVTSPETAKEIYRTNDVIFASRPSHHVTFKIFSYNHNDIIFSPYGSYWRQLRKICTMEVLSPKRVQTFKAIREDEVFDLIKSISLQKGSTINLSRRIFSLSYSITSLAAFGKRSKDTERFLKFVDEINGLASEFCFADMYPSVKFLQAMSLIRLRYKKVHNQIDEILADILNEHRGKIQESKQEGEQGGKEDIVDVLLNIQKRGDFEPQLTDTNIKAVILDVFGAGSETSSTAIEWAISEMIRNPETMKRAQYEVRNFYNDKGDVDESRLHELKYLHAIIKEALRLHPSAPLLLPRECGEECKINGYDIPAKAQIIVNAWAISRDPLYWSEAEKFNPSRFLDSEIDYKGNNFEYIPFGAGRRICPGISYSQAVVQLVLAQLLFHFDWKLPGDLKPEELDMADNLGVTIRRKNDLHLIPIPYPGSCLIKDN
ncbi:tabersonine 6,7-epoxidase-like [Coffea arabica]|uniref:Tabersonine 6,7-epoxidase-like n=1 Tax=Coffea arabica TaxID=13443 RepID=A0A6P6S6W6_COFAR|nr:tabersonine 16-hydroxylase 1-like [Coffea arabica]